MLQLAEHAEHLARIDAAIDVLSGRITTIEDDDTGTVRGYRPGPAPRWWALDAEGQAEQVARLTSWVEQILRPCYGQQAAGLASCWPRHRLALMTLDWLSELWAVLYLQPRWTAQTLAGMAEWQLRLLPAALEQVRRETTGCGHTPGTVTS